ncbi:MAG: hypothetical protein BA870_05360 [Desulfuromonadales bacterium C00003094]|jgi:hypothetical protein|nr:MAG: hypothetical protein BA870_05360 [Desulfuromonadales bacterium C00003094]
MSLRSVFSKSLELIFTYISGAYQAKQATDRNSFLQILPGQLVAPCADDRLFSIMEKSLNKKELLR